MSQITVIYKITNLLEEKQRFFEDNSYQPQFVYNQSLNPLNLEKYGTVDQHLVEFSNSLIERVLQEVKSLDEVKTLPSFYSVSLPKKPGDKVGLSSQGFKSCANIILFSKDEVQFKQDCQFLEDNCKAILVY